MQPNWIFENTGIFIPLRDGGHVSVGDVTMVLDILVLDMFMLFASHLRYLIGQCLKQISRIVCRYIDINHSSLSDKRPLISCPINTGREVMSLLTLILAAKLGCQQIASISQTIFVVSEVVRVTVALHGTFCEAQQVHRCWSIYGIEWCIFNLW